MDVITTIFAFLTLVEDFYWSYVGFVLVLGAGLYFTLKSGFFQLVTLLHMPTHLKDIINSAKGSEYGIHPIRLYFASVGGMVGLGNIVAVVTVVTIGGPGGLFWMWLAAFVGMIIKYCEIYLGVQYRVKNDRGGYDGGPMYFLQAAFKSRFIASAAAVFLLIYGVEIAQFTVLTDTFAEIMQVNRLWVVAGLLLLVLYSNLGGIRSVSAWCSVLMPPFMLVYIIACVYVISIHGDVLLALLKEIVPSAFSGHAAVGGFAGSTWLMAASAGTSRAVYSGDIGIGYDATVQSETRLVSPIKQARIAVFALLSDTLICTLSCLVLLVTGLWQSVEGMELSQYVRVAMLPHVPYVHLWLPGAFFIAGFTTIIGYFSVGMKAAQFLSPKFGRRIYYIYGCCAFVVFSYFEQAQVLTIMNICAGMLVLCNLSGLLRLRKQISFKN